MGRQRAAAKEAGGGTSKQYQEYAKRDARLSDRFDRALRKLDKLSRRNGSKAAANGGASPSDRE